MDNTNTRINSVTTGRTGQRSASNTPQNNRNIANNNSAASQSATKSMGRASDYGVARGATQLYEGDIVRGEISDLRNNEITVTLEDNTILKGLINDSSMLSIGQTAAFTLSGSNSGVILEPVKNSYTETELTLINKALQEANLPSTEHNQVAVKALMDNLLPINKESIQMLMQQSYDYQTDDMNTLAVMNRLMMDMTTDSVEQFSNYRNGTYQLIDKLQNLSTDIPDLLSALADNGPADSVATFGDKLISILLNPNTDQTNMNYQTNQTIAFLSSEQRQELISLLSATPLTEDTLFQLENGTLNIQDALTMLRDAITSGTLTLQDGAMQNQEALKDNLLNINMALEPTVDSEILVNDDSIKNIPIISTEALEGLDSAGDTAEDIPAKEPEQVNPDTAASISDDTDKKSGFANRFLQTITETAKNSLNNLHLFSQEDESVANNVKTDINPVIDLLCNKYSSLGREYDLLNTYLTQDDRNDLVNKLQNLPVSKALLDKITSGEATTKEVLTVIKNIIPLSDGQSIQDIFKSTAFESLFAKSLQSSWTLSPEHLKTNADIDSFYRNMQNQMKGFESLISTTLSGQDSENMSHNAHDIQSNIDFMKTLSDMFSYLQMPLKLQSQDAHGDLYVYTQKDKLKRNPNKIHVLLHLNMDNLGAIDVYLDKNSNEVNARFMLDNQPSIDLLNTNSDMLKTALNEQGYACQIKVEKADADTSTIDEFINTKINTSATAEMKRFSFDIRA